MIIYFTPGTGKTTFCKSHSEWTDGDTILAKIISDYTGKEIHGDDLHRTILSLYNANRDVLEDCYTEYKSKLMHAKANNDNILFGTRRFMWLADMVFIEDDPHILELRGRPGSFTTREIDYLVHTNAYERLNGKYATQVFNQDQNAFVYQQKERLAWLKDKP